MGEVVGWTEAAGLRLSETIHAPATQAAAHRHHRPYFCYVLQGQFVEDSERGAAERGYGSLVYHPPSAVHADHFSATGARCLNLELTASWQGLPQAPRDSLRLDGHRARWAVGRLFETWRRRGADSRYTVHGLVSLLLEEISGDDRPSRATPGWLTSATDILDREYRQAWSLKALAKRVGVSTSTLARGFRTRHGCSVGDYVHYRRVEEAIRLLATGNTGLGGLANRLGFADQSHLTRIFRRHTGLPPLTYASVVLGPTTRHPG
jgi:AraC family transcriptional regulator